MPLHKLYFQQIAMTTISLLHDSKTNCPTNQIPPKLPNIKTSNSSLIAPSFKDELLSQEVGGDYLVSLHTSSPMPPPQAVIEQPVGNPNNHSTPVEDNIKPQQDLITNESMAIDSPSTLVLRKLKCIDLTEEDINRMYSQWKYSLIIKLLGKRVFQQYLNLGVMKTNQTISAN